MLGARGVALGLGRVNLNDLRGLSVSQTRQNAMAQKKNKEKTPKVIIKKHVDRQTLWAACRAVLFGTVLIALGATMATIGYYAEQLATLASSINGTTVVRVVDESRKLQFASLSYVGPVVMGVGAFILMIACVMTLESRDKHAQVIHEYPKDTTDRLSRGASGRCGKRPPTSEEEKLPLNVVQQTEMQQEDETNNNNDTETAQSKNAEKLPKISKQGENRTTLPPPNTNNNTTTENFIAMRKLFRDDSKSNSRNPAENDSFPCSTTTTTLTWSRSVRDSDLGKFPSTSCIDSLMKKADTRALLQRFLEDQSRMVNRMQQQQQTKGGSLKKQSKSLEIPGTERVQLSPRNVRSEEMPVRHSIVAEIHPQPESPAISTSIFPVKKRSSPTGLAPIVRAESTEYLGVPEEYCSPMSLSSDNTRSGNCRKERTVIAPRNSDTSMSSFVSLRSNQSGLISTGGNNNNTTVVNISPLTVDSERFHSLSSSVATLQESVLGESLNGNLAAAGKRSISSLSPLEKPATTNFCPSSNYSNSRARTEHWINFKT